MAGHLGVDPGLHGASALLDGRGLLLVAGISRSGPTARSTS